MKNRILLGHFSHQPHHTNECLLPSAILPTTADDAALKKNFTVHISRVISKNMVFFNTGFSDVIDWHIYHPFYKENSKKSEVVSYFIALTNYMPYLFLLL